MPKLDELIRELCPDGVETKKLKVFLVIKNGSDYKRFGAGDYPVYGSGGIMTYIDRYAYDKPSVLIPRKGSIEKLYYVEEPFWNVDTIFYTEIDTTKAIPKYVYYCLQKKHLKEYNTAGGVPSLTQKVLNDIEIPLPPLEIQREIVRILDNFTKLTAELTVELTTRKTQYSYYRDKLLTFDVRAKKKKIGELTRVFSAARVHKNEWTTEGVPFYRSSDVISKFNGVENSRGKAYISFDLYKKLSEKSGKIMKDDILITGGGSIGIPYIVPTNDPIYVKDADLLCIQKSDKFNSRFLYHYFLSTEFRKYLKNITHNATIAHYTISQIEDTLVPLPSIEIQNRIVNVLDNFEKICSDLNIGLPAEIEARQKQYEYYRDKLLTFAETGNTILSRAEQSRAEQSRAEQSTD